MTSNPAVDPSRAGAYDAQAANDLARAQSGLYEAQAAYQRAQATRDQAQIEQAAANLREQQRQFDVTKQANDAAQARGISVNERDFANQEAWRREYANTQASQFAAGNALTAGALTGNYNGVHSSCNPGTADAFSF